MKSLIVYRLHICVSIIDRLSTTAISIVIWWVHLGASRWTKEIDLHASTYLFQQLNKIMSGVTIRDSNAESISAIIYSNLFRSDSLNFSSLWFWLQQIPFELLSFLKLLNIRIIREQNSTERREQRQQEWAEDQGRVGWTELQI